VNPLVTSSMLPSRVLLWTCRLLCTIALVASGYLAYTAFTSSEVYGCGGGDVFDCGHVLTSQYAKIFGVPVSVPAFGMYASLLGVLAFFRKGVPDRLLSAGWAILTVGALSAGLAALWFTGIQVFELEHLCAYCLVAHACGILLAGIVIWKRPLGWMKLSQLSGISAAGVALLITAQLTSEPPQTFTVETFDDVAAPESHLTSFVSPSATKEFGAPVEFAAPTEFAPPSDAADVFEPPTVAAEVVDNLFAPPTETPKVQPPVVESKGETKTAEDESDATTGLPEEVPLGAVESPQTPPLAKVAYLFFSPTANSGVLRLLPLFAADGESDADSDEQAEEPAAASDGIQVAAKPVTAPVTTERLVTVAGNRFSLNTRHWPLLGDPDAKYVFVEMFDYTCPHCRSTHKAIEGAFEKYGDELAVIALPVPLERSCNPDVKGDGHAGACEQARLAVAVWRCERAKFQEFHHWMFESNRTTSQAKDKAEQLIGKDRLAQELALDHAGDYVSKHVELYRRVGSGAVPKLMFPKSTMTGQVSSSSALVSAIQREFPGE